MYFKNFASTVSWSTYVTTIVTIVTIVATSKVDAGLSNLVTVRFREIRSNGYYATVSLQMVLELVILRITETEAFKLDNSRN